MTIEQLIQYATQQFQPISETPLLDAQFLLAETLKTNKAYLYTWPQKTLTELEQKNFLRKVQRHSQGEPVAYILGYKEFWSLKLEVTADTLIPRPETELIVDIALQLLPNTANLRLLELGTGSGAIAIALAHERPQWQLDATDISLKALAVAQRNATHYQCQNISFIQSNWFENLAPNAYDAIISNPPYIALHDTHLQNKALKFEPQTALASGETGLDALTEIIEKAPSFLQKNGLLILEHGFDQRSVLENLLLQTGYYDLQFYDDLNQKNRVLTARITYTS